MKGARILDGAIEITWPNKERSKTTLSHLPAGHHEIDFKKP